MKIRLLTVSHKQPSWVLAGSEDYARRLPREWGFQLVEIRPAPRTAGAATARVQADEGERLRAALPKHCCVVALDERGDVWSTHQLAERVGRWLHDGRDLALLVGGADGLAPDLRAEADLRWSLSALTLPHGLVRVLLLEQLYRVASLLRGHPYHK